MGGKGLKMIILITAWEKKNQIATMVHKPYGPYIFIAKSHAMSFWAKLSNEKKSHPRRSIQLDNQVDYYY
jgi:hypothetical protein